MCKHAKCSQACGSGVNVLKGKKVGNLVVKLV